MKWFFAVVDRIALAVTLGAGSFIVAGLRPLLEEVEGPDATRDTHRLVAGLRSAVWGRYNRVAMMAMATLAGTEALRALTGQKSAALRATGAGAAALALAQKDRIDGRIKAIVDAAPDPATVSSSEAYQAEVQQTMTMSIVALVLAGLLTAWPPSR